MMRSKKQLYIWLVLFPAGWLSAQEAAEPAPEHKTRITGYPYVYYTPETELAMGLGGIVTFYTSEEKILRPSKVTASGYYSIKGQYKFSLVPQLYFGANRWLVTTPLDFGRYVDKFFGIGSATPDNDDEDYVSQAFGARLEVQFPPFLKYANRSGVLYDFMYYDVTDKKNNPNLQDDVTGSDGGLTSGLGLAWVWDNRDHTFFPNRGGLHQVRATFYFSEIGSDFDFTSIEVDLRRYLAFTPDHVLALQLYGNFAPGDPPFYKMPALGGQNRMRGYYYGRFRDRQYMMGQIEYRAHVWRRLGFVAFFGIGDVAHEFREFDIREFKKSYGFGLRFMFNQAEKVNLRVDYGRGKDTSGIYFGLEEAF